VKLGDLAGAIGCQLDGDGDIDVARVATLEQAGPGALTFLANPKYASQLKSSGASAAIVPPGVVEAPCAMLRTPSPYLAFGRAIRLLHPELRPPAGVHPLACVAPDAVVGDEVTVGPFAVIASGVRIGARSVIHAHVTIGTGSSLGEDCLVHAHVSIRECVVIGARCILQDGAVIGSDGFGFAPRGDGTHEKIPQVAGVVLEDDVEIGAQTTVDRPAVGETRIKSGTKIDNLVQVAHGVTIGRNTLIAAQVGIAGSATIGDEVMLGGQVGINGHVTIGDRVKASAKTGLTSNIPADSFVTGYPHMKNLEWRKAQALIKRLPELRKQVLELERRLAELEDGRD
jgi:UDP-3-O-[3-hydroxymyristoyl] glucosamine N-acyltransferase